MRLDHRLQRFRVLPIDRNSNNPYLGVTLSSHSNRVGRIAALPSLIHREGLWRTLRRNHRLRSLLLQLSVI